LRSDQPERGASENGSRLYRSLTHLISGASRIRCKAIVDACDEHEGRVLGLLPEIDGIVDLLKHSQFDFMSNATKQRGSMGISRLLDMREAVSTDYLVSQVYLAMREKEF
jgi:hypothetical protein